MVGAFCLLGGSASGCGRNEGPPAAQEKAARTDGQTTVQDKVSPNQAVAPESLVYPPTDLAPTTTSPSVLTHHNDRTRSGAQLNETILTPALVKTKGMRMAVSRKNLSALVSSQPLYWHGLDIGGQTRNVVFVTTNDDNVYAYDADDTRPTDKSGGPWLWKTTLVDPVAPTKRPFAGKFGSIGTPVIDAAAGIVYVVYQTTNCFGRATCTGTLDTTNAMTPADCVNLLGTAAAATSCSPESALDSAYWIAKLDVRTGAVLATSGMLAATAPAAVTTSGSCGVVTTSAPTGAPIGTTMSVRILPDPACAGMEYKFILRKSPYPAGQFTVLANYSTSDTFVWNTTGFDATEYRLSVVSRAPGATSSVETPQLTYALTQPPGTCGHVTTSVPSGAAPGTSVTLRMVPDPACAGMQYKFLLRKSPYPAGQFTILQNYSNSDTFTWDTIGLDPTEYRLSVVSRAAGGAASVETPQSAFSLSGTAPAPATPVDPGDAAAPAPAGPCGHVTTSVPSGVPPGTVLTVRIVPDAACAGMQYKFILRKSPYPAGQFTVVQSYSDSDTFVWDTTGLEPTDYRLSVVSRAPGATTSVETPQSTFTLTPFAGTPNPAGGTLGTASTCGHVTTSVPSGARPGTFVNVHMVTDPACAGMQYKFVLRKAPYVAGQFTVLKNYSASDTFVWDTAGLDTGEYALSVVSRAAGATNSVETPRTTFVLATTTPMFSFKASRQKQASALLLDHGFLYIPFASRYDEHTHPYHGWVLRYDAATLSPHGSFSTTPSQDTTRIKAVATSDIDGVTIASGGRGGGSIWGGGAGLAADADGNVYFTTANGPSQRPDYGQSIVKLTPRGDELLPTAFTEDDPDAEKANLCDVDLGSGGIVLLPGGRALGGGKRGDLHLVDRTSLNEIRRFSAACSQYTGAEYPNLPRYANWDDGPHLHGAPAVWTWDPSFFLVYVWGEADRLRAYKYLNGNYDFDPAHATCDTAFATGSSVIEYRTLPPPYEVTTLPNGCSAFTGNPYPTKYMPGGMLSVSANGNTRGTGILWANSPRLRGSVATDGDKASKLFAYDAETLEQLWVTSTQIGHFTPPTIAAGHVINVTGTGFDIYQLNP